MSILTRLAMIILIGVAVPAVAQETAPEPTEATDTETPAAEPETDAAETEDAAESTPPPSPPIVVIAPFDLTGDEASLDVAAANGALLAANQINEAGGIDGRDISLFMIDTKSDPKNVGPSVEAALAQHPDAVAGIGYTYSGEALIAGKVFQAKGLPFISPGATDPRVPAEVGDDMFYAAYGDNAQALAMARFMREELKIERVAIWIDNSRLYPRTIGEDFERSLKNSVGQSI